MNRMALSACPGTTPASWWRTAVRATRTLTTTPHHKVCHSGFDLNSRLLKTLTFYLRSLQGLPVGLEICFGCMSHTSRYPYFLSTSPLKSSKKLFCSVVWILDFIGWLLNTGAAITVSYSVCISCAAKAAHLQQLQLSVKSYTASMQVQLQYCCIQSCTLPKKILPVSVKMFKLELCLFW